MSSPSESDLPSIIQEVVLRVIRERSKRKPHEQATPKSAAEAKAAGWTVVSDHQMREYRRLNAKYSKTEGN